MQLDKLVKAINDINVTLDRAEAANDDREQDQLLREAAVRACRAYTEAVSEGELEADAAELGQCPKEAHEQARELLANEGSFSDLVRAELSLLRRLGIQENVVELLGVELREVERRPFDPSSVSMLRKLREVVCALRDRLQGEARRERRKKKIFGGVMGLAGLALIGASAPLALVASPLALASGGLGAALAKKGLDRAMGD